MSGSPEASTAAALSADALKVLALARGWAADGGPNDDLFDGRLLADIVGVPELDEAIEEASADLDEQLGSRSIQFLADLHSELMAGEFEYVTSDGREMTGDVRTFYVHLFGPEGAIGDFASDPAAVGEMATSLMDHGVAHPTSTVFLMPFVIPVLSLLEVTPGATRRATARVMEAMASKLTTGNPGSTVVEDLRLILDGVFPCAMEIDGEGAALTSYYLYGMRFVPREANAPAPMDDYVRGFRSPTVVRDEATEGLDEGRAWSEAMAERFVDLDVDAPNDWQGALGEATAAIVSHCVCSEADTFGLKRGAKASKAHLHAGDEYLSLAFRFDRTVLGPIMLPMRLAMANIDVVVAHAEEAAETLVEHGTAEGFAESLGTFH